ncbi:MAG: nucleoside triphosphate pyrophosphohydrolase family protein [Gemmatimonadota bacterium]|nr:nucleoside triphosphate pyrophosphohydrolase family protein [Gemmatimonadota bacterium]
MKDQLDCVKHFHEVFRCHLERSPVAELPSDVSEWRIRMLLEELEEYRAAVGDNDIVEIADALTDMLYVLLGTFITHGLQDIAEELFDEVHRSNMSKLDDQGKPIFRNDGKVLKSERFSEPDLRPILAKAGQVQPE